MNYKKPICKTCFVRLDARNLDSVKVFMTVRNQYVTIGPVGYPIAVKVEAVMAALELFNVEERERVFMRVTEVINGHFIKDIQKGFKKK
jgi:hypothetical protein